MYPNSQWDSAEEEGRYTWQPYVPPEPVYGVQDPQPDWTTDPNATPPWTIPGQEWFWNGSRWQTRNAQQQPAAGAGDAGLYDYGTGGGGGSEWGYLTEPFTGTPPQWQSGPTFSPPSFSTPPAFNFKEFQAPTKDGMYADPSYDFRFGPGQKSLEQSAAGRGILRTGGTLKDLVNYGQNAASQEYSNIFDRAVQSHNLGLQQALGTYATNYGVQRDAYDRLFDSNKAVFDAQQRENFAVNDRNFDSFLADFDIF
jgi:hypothetical protein